MNYIERNRTGVTAGAIARGAARRSNGAQRRGAARTAGGGGRRGG